MVDRNLPPFERRNGAVHSEDGTDGSRQTSSTIANLPASFARQIWDEFWKHLAEVVALAVFAVLAGMYFVFIAKVRLAEARLDSLRVSGFSAVFAAVASGVLGGVVTGVFVSRRFRRITNDLRRQIAGLEQESALEQTNEQKVRAAVEAAMAAAAETGERLALVLVDIDDFRRLNNEYSYDTGNFVLRQFSKLLSSNVRGSRDRVMRYFERGDEFLIVLPGTDLDNAYQGVAERLRKLVKDNRFLLSDGPEYRGEFCEITISAGVTASSPGEEWKDVRDRIVTALHDAKSHGKDRCVRIRPDSLAGPALR